MVDESVNVDEDASLAGITSSLENVAIKANPDISPQPASSIHSTESPALNASGINASSSCTPQKTNRQLSLVTPEAGIFSTPKNAGKECCNEDTCLCSVCLSPLFLRGAVVETLCKHKFHEGCLREVKGWKSECPNCRAMLTPLPKVRESPSIMLDGPTAALRNNFHNRVSSAREAVRLANIRREHERQRSTTTDLS